MLWSRGEASETTNREAARYDFAVPAVLELSNGFFRRVDQLDVLLVELSEGGAALIAPEDRRFKTGKRYRIWVDDQSGILQLRNISALPANQVRLGAAIHRLDLVLQELVADSLEDARHNMSRLANPTDV